MNTDGAVKAITILRRMDLKKRNALNAACSISTLQPRGWVQNDQTSLITSNSGSPVALIFDMEDQTRKRETRMYHTLIYGKYQVKTWKSSEKICGINRGWAASPVSDHLRRDEREDEEMIVNSDGTIAVSPHVQICCCYCSPRICVNKSESTETICKNRCDGCYENKETLPAAGLLS